MSSENIFIDATVYDACVEPGRPDLSGALFIGCDAAVRRDCAAIVCIKYEDATDRLSLADYKISKPSPGQPINKGNVRTEGESEGSFREKQKLQILVSPQPRT